MQNVMSGQWSFMNYKSTFLELNNIRNTHKNLFDGRAMLCSGQIVLYLSCFMQIKSSCISQDLQTCFLYIKVCALFIVLGHQ